MKTKLLTAGLATVFGAALADPAGAQTELGTAFTYQGKLEDAGSPANGLYDFEFKLCDDSVTPCTLGTITVGPHDVVDGLFTVEVDFGAGIFNGQARWLEMGVRPDGSADPYTVLSPRQELTPAPYALYAASAPGGSGYWESSGNDIYNTNAGNVGIGTSTPRSVRKLDVVTDVALICDGGPNDGEACITDAECEPGGSCVSASYPEEAPSAVVGRATATDTRTNGVMGITDGAYGNGVVGLAFATTGYTTGVRGMSWSPDGLGGDFYHWADTGAVPAVGGSTYSTDDHASAVMGFAAGDSGATIGVLGECASPDGYGVKGKNFNGGDGGYFTCEGPSCTAVRGHSGGTGNSYGVHGSSTGPDGYAGYFIGRGFFSGNVGIGTGAIFPAEELDVDGNIQASGTITSGSSITIDGTTDTITASSGTISFDDENVVAGGTITSGSSITIDGTSGIQSINSSGSLIVRTGGFNRMFINNGDGKVGVGTTSPSAVLQANVDPSSSGPAVAGITNHGGSTYPPLLNEIGVYGSATSDDPVAVYGVYGIAGGSATRKYGVYGAAFDPGGTNWAGYFNGPGYFSGDLSVGTKDQQAALHVEDNDISLPSGALNNDDLILEDADAKLGLYSDEGGVAGSGIALAEITGGAFVDKWSILRETASGGKGLRFNFGTSTNDWVNSTVMHLDDTGNIGIGRTSSANDLEVEGTASKTTAGDWLANSDRRIKTDIAPLGDALETIDRLRPVQFKYIEVYREKHPSIEDKHYLNFVAQEYQEVFPDFVKDSGEDGLLQIDTHPANVYAVAAIQELHKVVKQRDTQIATQQQQIAELSARLAALEKLVQQADAGQEGGVR